MRKILITSLVILITTPSWSADIHKSVKQSGGDYTTMDDCVDANAQDLTGVGNLYCEASGTWSVNDTDPISIPGGYTTDATHRIIFTALNDGARHSGVAGTTNYRLVVASFNNGLSGGSTSYVTVENLVIQGGSNSAGIIPARWPATGWIVQNNIVSGFGGACLDASGDSVPGALVKNNYFYDCDYGVYGYFPGGTNSLYYNNTIHSVTTTGFHSTGGTSTTLKNNLIIESGTADISCSGCTMSANGTSDATGQVTSLDEATELDDAAGRDVHLASGATSIGAGDDLSGSFTDDIDGDTRSSWDIGADEFDAGGGGGSRRIILVQ